MNRFHRGCIGSAFFLLSACGSVQVDGIDNEAGINGPSSLVGKISDGKYSAAIGLGWGSGSFTVAIPEARDPYEFRHLWRDDARTLGVTRVTFGPAALDATVYRLTVGSKGNNLQLFHDEYLPKALEMAQKKNDFPMKLLKQEQVRVNGHPAIYEVYEQVIQDTKGELLPFYNRGLYTHGFYTIDFGDYAAFAWTEATTGSGVNAVDKIEQRKFLTRTWEPQEYFIRSLKTYP